MLSSHDDEDEDDDDDVDVDDDDCNDDYELENSPKEIIETLRLVAIMIKTETVGKLEEWK